MSQPRANGSKEEKGKQNNEVVIPDDYLCPISHQIMLDPVSTADGETYEREEIERWLQNHNTSPRTNEQLADKKLTPTKALKRVIGQFLENNPSLWEGDQVYASKALTENLIKAVANGDQNEISRILSIDKRLLKNPLADEKNLLSLALEQKSLPAIQLVVGKLGRAMQDLPEVKNDSGVAIFRKAVHELGVEGAKIIGSALNWNAKQYQQQFWQGIQNNNAQLVAACLELKADPTELNAEGLRPVHVVAEKEQKELLTLFVAQKQIDSLDAKGNTPLIRAIVSNKMEQVNLLIETGANVNQANAQGLRPLEVSIHQIRSNQGSIRVVERLLEAKAVPDIVDTKREPLFTQVLLAGMTDVLRLLTRYHVDVNKSGADGELPIHKAFMYTGRQLEEVLGIILAGGAKVEAKDAKGDTPLQKAVRIQNLGAVKLLADYKANLKVTDEKGNTVLHQAATCNFEELTKLLLQSRADPNVKNKDRQSPAKVASLSNYENVASVLRQVAFERKMEPIVAPLQQKVQRLEAELSELKEFRPVLQFYKQKKDEEDQKIREEKLPQEKNTEALVKSCISGDLKEVKRLVDQKTDVNRPDSTGMTPLLGAYWGLNLDVIQLLGTCGVVGITGEQADQELKKMEKYDVVGELEKVTTYGEWADWFEHTEHHLLQSKGLTKIVGSGWEGDPLKNWVWARGCARGTPGAREIFSASEGFYSGSDGKNIRMGSRGGPDVGCPGLGLLDAHRTECIKLMETLIPKPGSWMGMSNS